MYTEKIRPATGPSILKVLSTRDHEVHRPPTRLITKEDLPKFLQWMGVHRYDLFTWYTSWCLPIAGLFVFRFLAALHTLIILVGALYVHQELAKYPFFFTYLSGYLLLFYFAFHTWHTYRLMRAPNSYFYQQAQSTSPWHLWFLQFLYSGTFTFHIIVTVVYWTILYKPGNIQSAGELWIDIGTHLVPIALLLIEAFVNNRFHIQAVEVFQTVLSMFVYMLWAWFGAFMFYRFDGTAWWVYKFLSFRRSTNVFYYIGLFIGTFVAFFLVYALHMIKRSWIPCSRSNQEQSSVDSDEKLPA